MCDTNNPKKTLTDVYRFGVSALSLQFEEERTEPGLSAPTPTANPHRDVSAELTTGKRSFFDGITAIQIVGGVWPPPSPKE
jgi:hypothetical protein